MTKGCGRRVGVGQRLLCDPGLVRGLELVAEAVHVEVGDLRLPRRSASAQAMKVATSTWVCVLARPSARAASIRIALVRPRGRSLLAVPPGGLVAAPRRGERRHDQQDGDEQLLPVAPAVGRGVSVRRHARHREPTP
jgi:hypothetical protein